MSGVVGSGGGGRGGGGEEFEGKGKRGNPEGGGRGERGSVRGINSRARKENEGKEECSPHFSYSIQRSADLVRRRDRGRARDLGGQPGVGGKLQGLDTRRRPAARPHLGLELPVAQILQDRRRGCRAGRAGVSCLISPCLALSRIVSPCLALSRHVSSSVISDPSSLIPRPSPFPSSKTGRRLRPMAQGRARTLREALRYHCCHHCGV